MKKRMLIPLFLLLVSCKQEINYIDFDTSLHQSKKDQFEQKEPQKYSYTYIGCENTYQEYRVYVTDHNVDSIVPDTTDFNILAYTDVNKQSLHISNLFGRATIAYSLYNGINTKDRDFYYTGISCTYDETYHFPTSYNYSFYQAPNLCIDGGNNFTITDFTVLEE